MTQFQETELEIDEPVATVRMKRPETLNALTDQGWNELRTAFSEAEADPRVVGIILTGAGRGFCAGYDMTSLHNAAETGAPDIVPSPSLVGDPDLDQSRHDPAYISALRKPVIAAVNGPAAGGGMVLALWCDIRIASESAVLTVQFPKLGLTAESGIGWILPRIIGTSKALDLLWTVRKVRAEEAERIGLVDRVIPDDQLLSEARTYIVNLADSVAPWSLMEAKRMVYRGWEESAGAAIDHADLQATESMKRRDLVEGTHAFAERRPPRFARLTFKN